MKKVQDQRSKVSHQHKFLEKSLSGYDKLAKKEKKLFLSGLFDGEGSFGFWSKGKNKSRSLQVKVETTDADMISRFHEMWGGNFFAIDRKKLNHKSLFRWQLTGDKAWNCLQEMIPYMCKRRKEKYYGLVKPTGYGSEDWGSYLQKQTRQQEINVRRSQTTRSKDGSR